MEAIFSTSIISSPVRPSAQHQALVLAPSLAVMVLPVFLQVVHGFWYLWKLCSSFAKNSKGLFLTDAGLHYRQQLMLHYCIFKFKLLDGVNACKVWLVPSEKSPPFVQYLTPDKWPAACPKSRACVVSKRLRRISLLTVPEFLRTQQLHLYDFCFGDLELLNRLCAEFSHTEWMRMCGNAFHSSSCGSFMVGNWLLKRHEGYCRGVRVGDWWMQ